MPSDEEFHLEREREEGVEFAVVFPPHFIPANSTCHWSTPKIFFFTNSHFHIAVFVDLSKNFVNM